MNNFFKESIVFLCIFLSMGIFAKANLNSPEFLTKKFYDELSCYGLTHKIIQDVVFGGKKIFQLSCLPFLESGGLSYRSRNLIHLGCDPRDTSEKRIGIFLHELGHASDRLWNSSLSRFFHPQTFQEKIPRVLGGCFLGVTVFTTLFGAQEHRIDYNKKKRAKNKFIIKTTAGLGLWLTFAEQLSFLRTEFIADKSVVQLSKKLSLPSTIVNEFKNFLTSVHKNRVDWLMKLYPYTPPIFLKIFDMLFSDLFNRAPHPPIFLRKILLDMEKHNLPGFDIFIGATTALLLGGPLISVGLPMIKYRQSMQRN